ncbi:hypothetical protein [uncultured Aquimarina sp.]|uniref:hypothetical protein n=1 Tax=uncultured Aquimarina sp. TaxID=575652 RepID=UPI00261A39E2|nr:hypothetical protein [uncultured Aquimarina sp.]
MKNFSLDKLRCYEMSKSITKKVNGGDVIDDCVATAERDGNDWMIDKCYEILGDLIV